LGVQLNPNIWYDEVQGRPVERLMMAITGYEAGVKPKVHITGLAPAIVAGNEIINSA
jgi:hypothetical protein